MTTRRQALQFLALTAAGVGTARRDGLELLATANAQTSDDPAAELTAYGLFKPALEQAFPGRPLHRLYEEGYSHETKQAGDVYAIIGSDHSFLVKSVDIYRSGPFEGSSVLIDNSVLSVDDNRDGTYTVMTGASYTVAASGTGEQEDDNQSSGGSCYASATGRKENIEDLLKVVKAWQDAYDAIFSDAKKIFHAQDSRTRQQKLESILGLYQERFPRLADQQQWTGLTISAEAQTVLRNLATTYDLDDVAQSLMKG
ncbi:MAG TPA: hypothetical protein VJI15_00235 [Candidatus Nanoarchaeia archaeon]|nr:hypothetical protein [Candidatus Nanoarchaeia archaeon]